MKQQKSTYPKFRQYIDQYITFQEDLGKTTFLLVKAALVECLIASDEGSFKKILDKYYSGNELLMTEYFEDDSNVLDRFANAKQNRVI